MRYNVSQHNAERVISLPDAEIASRYESGETIAELAAAYSVSRPTITKSLDRSSVKRRPAKQRDGKMAGSRNPSWRGGRRQRVDGYWLVWTEQGERLEHRVVMEKKIGRRLKDIEVVHHIDEDRSNNDPNNLELLPDQSTHIRHHLPEMHAARFGK